LEPAPDFLPLGLWGSVEKKSPVPWTARSSNETFEKCSILVKVKPPACRAYGPEGKAKISTTGIYTIFRGLEFEPDPSTIFRSYGADAEIGQNGAFCKGLRSSNRR